jgi:hypothetical protein
MIKLTEDSKSKHRSRDRALLTYSSESSDPESEKAAELHPEHDSQGDEESSGMEESDAQMLREMSDEEDKVELAEALALKASGRHMVKQGRRTFTQAKALVREVRTQRKKPMFFPKRNLQPS